MTTPAAPTAPGALHRADLLAIISIALAVAAWHTVQGGVLAGTVLLQSFNWVFDFDASRFVGAWCTVGADVAADMDMSFLARHALSLPTRALCLALTPWQAQPTAALMLLTALLAGAVAALAYLLAAAWCASVVDRALLALAYAVSVHPLLLALIPETYGWALAGIGLHLVLLARADGRPLGGGWGAILSALIDVGVTVTNAVLNLLSSAVLSWRRMTLRAWLLQELRVWGLALLLLLLIVGLSLAIFAPQMPVQAGVAVKKVWWTININRGEPAALWEVIRTFFIYSFVAPAFTVVPLPPPDGHPMLDFRSFSYGLAGAAALALWSGALACSVMLAWASPRQRRLLVVAALWMAMNVVLHWYWQYRGSIYLYGAHTSFVLFAVLAMGYGSALQRWAGPLRWRVRAYAAALVLLTAWNNLGVYREMIDFLLRQPSVA